MDPQPVPQDIALAYGNGYYTHSTEQGPVSLGRNAPMRALRGAVLSSRYGYAPLRPDFPLADVSGWLLSRIPAAHRRATMGWLRAIPPWRAGGKLLEIGCGDGNYLFPMRELGWELHAIEPDVVSAERTARATGAKIWPGDVETALVPQNSFDAVVSFHAIEHVYDPRVFIGRAARFLRPGGFLCIVTPNFQSMGRKRFGADWLALDVPRHLNLLTPASMRSLCESTGLLRIQSLRALTRRARREQEHAYAVRQTGNFNGDFKPTVRQSVAIGCFSRLEKLLNPFLQWGEEIELIARRL